MSKSRIIYARPGDMIEIRMVCHDDFDLNASDWREQTHPTSMLLMAVETHEIAFANPMTRQVPWPSHPSGGDRHVE
ncbi:hypothetical protein HD884_002170 [Ochrobactrum intermedium]|uniref:hypothetical protein n=1 Tax=Brucella intermedia TaxID=94625 RepID=UPI0007C2FF48|nr:hypothetical protein [Brucella intermedia]NYD82107.1 hypothetical protein [Brucella intermedia]OAB82886.1 hypothetical protein A4G21_10345 [Brucella intermedia]